jgi:hypothetical protein
MKLSLGTCGRTRARGRQYFRYFRLSARSCLVDLRTTSLILAQNHDACPEEGHADSLESLPLSLSSPYLSVQATVQGQVQLQGVDTLSNVVDVLAAEFTWACWACQYNRLGLNGSRRSASGWEMRVWVLGEREAR